VIAYDKDSGKPLWASLDDKTAYVSPMLATIAGRLQILTLTAQRVVGLGVENGTLLWEYPWVTSSDVNSAQPVLVDSEHVFVSSGYGHGSVLLKIEDTHERLTARKVWENILMKNKFNSSVIHEGYIYGLDEQILACLDAKTGARQWKGGRYGYGQILLVQRHLIVLTEDGEVALVRANPDSHQELARFRAMHGRTWNHPALAEGLLIVRNEQEMVCYDLSLRTTRD
jgi:outer membrane protein assembly factor BamB